MVVNQFGLLLSILIFLLITGVLLSLGIFVLGHLQALDFRLRTICFSVVVGIGCLGTILGWLSVLRLFNIYAVLSLFGFLLLFVLKDTIVFFRGYFASIDPTNWRMALPIRGANALLLGWIAIVFALYLFGALAPPTGGDALWHNLAMPKVIAVKGTYLDLWRLRIGPDHTETPKLVDHLYALGLLLGTDTVSTLFNFLFLSLILLVVFEFTSSYINRRFALWSVLAVALMPAVTYLGRETKVDLGLAIFELCSVYCFYLFKRSHASQWLLLSSALVGFAAGTRYTAITLTLVLTLFIGFELITRPSLRLQWRVTLASWLIPGTAVAAVWYAANLIRYGNPLFPFYDSLFRRLFPNLALATTFRFGVVGDYMEAFSQFRVPTEGLFGWLYPFWHFSFRQGSEVANWSEMWGPLVLAALPMVFLIKWYRETWVRWALVYVGLSYMAWVNQVHLTRTFLAPLIVLTVISVGSLLKTPPWPSRLLRVGLICLFCWSNLVLLRSTYGCIPFGLGVESRPAFLQRELGHVPNFPSYRMASASYALPDSCRILLYNCPSGYYFRNYTCGVSRPVSSPQDFLAALHADQISHVYFHSFHGWDRTPSEPERDPLISPLVSSRKLRCIVVDTVRIAPSPISHGDTTEWKQYLFQVTDQQ